jgi:hypothetical protein
MIHVIIIFLNIFKKINLMWKMKIPFIMGICQPPPGQCDNNNYYYYYYYYYYVVWETHHSLESECKAWLWGPHMFQKTQSKELKWN